MASRGLLTTDVKQPVTRAPTSEATEVGFLHLGDFFLRNAVVQTVEVCPSGATLLRGFAEQPGVLVRLSAGRSRVRIPPEPPFSSECSADWQRARLGTGRPMVRIHPLRPVCVRLRRGRWVRHPVVTRAHVGANPTAASIVGMQVGSSGRGVYGQHAWMPSSRCLFQFESVRSLQEAC